MESTWNEWLLTKIIILAVDYYPCTNCCLLLISSKPSPFKIGIKSNQITTLTTTTRHQQLIDEWTTTQIDYDYPCTNCCLL